MTQAEYLKQMEWWADGERFVPEAFIGGMSNVNSHFVHWQRVQELLNEGDRAIEVGCGCGLSSRIYSLKTKCELVAVDKPEVVSLSQQMYPTPGVTFHGADFNTDWYRKRMGKFDVVVCVDVIEHVQNKEVMLSNLAILGHEQTRWILTTPIGPDDVPWHVHHWESVEEFLDDVCRYLPRERVVRV